MAVGSSQSQKRRTITSAWSLGHRDQAWHDLGGDDVQMQIPGGRVIRAVLKAGPGTYLQFRSVAQLCPTLCDPMNFSTPGFPVHHQLPEFTQTHVYRVSDAIQPCFKPRLILCPGSTFHSYSSSTCYVLAVFQPLGPCQ